MANHEVEGRRPMNILIIPFPAQGHMLPMLDLTHYLSLHSPSSIKFTILTTPNNLSYISPLLSNHNNNISSLVLPFPSHPAIPPGIANCFQLPRQSQVFRNFIHALSSLRSPLLSLLSPSPPHLIISDFFLGWTHSLATHLSIPRIAFSPSSALTLAINHHTWTAMPDPPETDTDLIHYPSLDLSVPWYQLSTLYREREEGDEVVKEGMLANLRSWGVVVNTFDGLEGVYLEHLKRVVGHGRVWAVGPVSLLPKDNNAERGGPSTVSAGEVAMWLDRCSSGSVVYVCFGSQAVLTKEQTTVVANALKESGINFVWIINEGPTLPTGFKESTEGRGLVIKGWAPQVEVLNHKSVGCFFTHCGWNSILEGVAAGVTMLMWPMGADQFYNAMLLENAGVGVRVCERRDRVPKLDVLRNALVDSVRSSGEANEKARQLSRKAMESVFKDGSSRRDLDDLVETLSKL